MSADRFKNDMGNDSGALKDALSEHDAFIVNAKKFLCILLGVFSVLGVIFGYFYRNSKYLECYLGFKDGTSNLLPPIGYSVINSAAFLCLAVFAFTCFGTYGRDRKLKEAKAGYSKSYAGYTDIYREKKSVSKIAKAESSVKAAKTISIISGGLSAVLFTVLYALSGVSGTVINLSKDPIDRTNDVFRIIIDCAGQGFFTVSIVIGVVIIPSVIRGFKKYKRVFLYIVFTVSALSAVHYGFFFFGNITAHASVMDFSAMVSTLCVCGFIGVYIADETRKKILSGFNKPE